MNFVPGLGHVPDHWRTERARWVIQRQRRLPRRDDGVVTAFRDGIVTLRSNRREDGFTQAVQEIGYQGIRSGDLVVHGMDGFAGAIGVADSAGKASPVVHAYTAPNADVRFLAYTLRQLALGGYVQALAKGIRERSTAFDSSTLADVLIPIPPLDEQRRIADFLDGEIARIDRLSDKRWRQIGLIEERAHSREYQKIKGMNEAEGRKHSGLRWLGYVPKSWPIARVSGEFSVQLGKMLNQERASNGRLRAYLRNTNVQWGRVDTTDLLEMDFPLHERRRYGLRKGDLLVCEGGDPGRAAIWDGSVDEIYYQKALHRVRPRGYSRSKWLYYCLRVASAMNVFAAEGNVATISHLTGEQLLSHRFPFPSSDVQDRTVADLDDADAADETLISGLSRQLELLAERRRAVITAAVAGKFDTTTAGAREVSASRT